MLNPRIIYLNGLQNQTLAKMLSEKLEEAVYLEGKELVSPEDLSPQQWTVATVMTGTLKGCELAHEGKTAIISFPLREADWKVVSGLCHHAGVKPICISFASEMEPAPAFSSLVLKNSSDNSEEACEKILKLFAES